MSWSFFPALAVSLSLTIALELALIFILGIRDKKDLLLVVLVNIITNPLVMLLYWLAVSYTSWHQVIIKAPLELFAIVTEGYYYKKYGQGFKRPYTFAVAANIFSFGIGELLKYLLKGA